MINIGKGRYWDLPWSLVDGCTPCSPGCEHCWSASIEHRFRSQDKDDARYVNDWQLTTHRGLFNGLIRTHPERLSIPLKRRKPTVYSLWNDWAHEAVTFDFQKAMIHVALAEPQHTFLALTKRPQGASNFFGLTEINPPDNWWTGLTVCNQAEADTKIAVFLQVPGKKFLSIEPMLGPIWISGGLITGQGKYVGDAVSRIDAVILGGETGPGARPMHPDWVRSVRDQCATAGVPFFFKGWGEWRFGQDGNFYRDGRKSTGRKLDGRTHNDLPWRTV